MINDYKQFNHTCNKKWHKKTKQDFVSTFGHTHTFCFSFNDILERPGS